MTRVLITGMSGAGTSSVTWLQLALLGADLPGAAKAGLVSAGAVAAGWTLSAALRRVPAVARVV